MGEYVEKESKDKSRSQASKGFEGKSREIPTSRIMDERPENLWVCHMQEVINNSSRMQSEMSLSSKTAPVESLLQRKENNEGLIDFQEQGVNSDEPCQLSSYDQVQNNDGHLDSESLKTDHHISPLSSPLQLKEGESIEPKKEMISPWYMKEHQTVANSGVLQLQEDTQQSIPSGGTEVDQIGIVNWTGTPQLRLRSSPDTNTDNKIKDLSFNTTVYVVKEFPGDWYYITTEDGDMGYVAKSYIWTHLPEPNAKLHKVEAGGKGTAIAIAEKYYGDKADDWGQDLRFYVNILGKLNKKDVPDTTDGWKQVRFDADDLIWIPSQPFAYGMKGLVNSGSISYEAMDDIGLAEFVENMAQRLEDIKAAIKASTKYMAQAIARHVEEALVNVLVSLALMVIAAIAILAVSTAIGAGLGALAGGVGAAPGAAAGFEVGMVILEWLGLGMLIAWVGQALWETGAAFATFFGTVWNANGDEEKIDQAAWEFADAIGVLIGNLLEAVVMYAASVGLAKGMSALRNSRMGKSMGETKSGQWLTERVRRFSSGEAPLRRPMDVFNSITRGVEYVDSNGSPLGEFDGVDMRNSLFIENKSASGLSRVNPRTGRPAQTAQQWAQKQITRKSTTRINNLSRASSTRAANGADYSVPNLTDIQGIKHIHFKLDGNSPALQAAVFAEIAVLKTNFPGWKFTVEFGLRPVLPPIPNGDSIKEEKHED